MRRSLLLVTLLAMSACAGADPATTSAELSRVRRYIVIATHELPPGLEETVGRAGATVTRLLPEIGVAMVESSDPSFRARLGDVAGLQSVIPDLAMLPETSPAVPVIAQAAGTTDAALAAPASASAPAEIFYPVQWGLHAVGAKQLWDQGFRGQGVKVCVLDTGVGYYPSNAGTPPPIEAFPPDLVHLDVARSRSFVAGQAFYRTISLYFGPFAAMHGTETMAIIGAAVNGQGVVGVAPEADLIAVKVQNDQGVGQFGDVLSGLVYAASIPCDVANMSINGSGPRNGGCDPYGDCMTAAETSELITAFNRAVAYATQQGMTIVASAGNDALDYDHSDENTVNIPGSLPDVLTVAATGPVAWGLAPRAADPFQPASYSNFGQSYVDFAAPGGDVRFFDRPDAYRTCPLAGWSGGSILCGYMDWVLTDSGIRVGPGRWAEVYDVGTSFAAPHVAGLAALLVSANGGRMTPQQVAAALRAHALDLGKPGHDARYGAGFAHAGTCQPATCVEAGLCGTVSDGCGGMLDCGGCPAGSVCRADTSTCCVRASCDGLCGTIDDGCGGSEDCGGCDAGTVCTASNVCCTPLTCADQGAACGSIDNGCGASTFCGGCDAGEVCTPSHACCTPISCADQAGACGWIDDGCGGSVYCPGDCSPVLSFGFFGKVTYVSGSTFGLSPAVGTAVSGSMRWDPSLPPAYDTGSVAGYIQPPPSGMTVTIAGLTIESQNGASLQVLNNAYGVDNINGFFSEISAGAQGSGGSMTFYLADSTQTVFSSTALPTSLDASDFTTRTGSVSNGGSISFSIDVIEGP